MAAQSVQSALWSFVAETYPSSMGQIVTVFHHIPCKKTSINRNASSCRVLKNQNLMDLERGGIILRHSNIS